MTGAAAVLALVLTEYVVGMVAAAAWTQSWSVVSRGHFRVVAWCAVVLAALALVSDRAALAGGGGSDQGIQAALVLGMSAAVAAYVLVQHSNTDRPGTVVGCGAAVLGGCALVAAAPLIPGWPPWLASVELLTGAALLGAVLNGMLLGHWYLNQPGLRAWALARLTTFALGATAAAGVAGVAASGRLATASTEGAVLGVPGFGSSFGALFFSIWLALVVFTGVVLWMARRCVRIRSIQSATGLYYVAVLTAGVSELLVRYLMVNAP